MPHQVVWLPQGDGVEAIQDDCTDISVVADEAYMQISFYMICM